MNPKEAVPTQGMAVYPVETRASSQAKTEPDNTIGMISNIWKRPKSPGLTLTLAQTMSPLVNIHTWSLRTLMKIGRGQDLAD